MPCGARRNSYHIAISRASKASVYRVCGANISHLRSKYIAFAKQTYRICEANISRLRSKHIAFAKQIYRIAADDISQITISKHFSNGFSCDINSWRNLRYVLRTRYIPAGRDISFGCDMPCGARRNSYHIAREQSERISRLRSKHIAFAKQIYRIATGDISQKGNQNERKDN